MAKILNNLLLEEKDITDLRQLIALTILQDEDFKKYTRIVPAVNGEKVGFIGDMMDVGVAGGGCNPNYQAATIANSEKKWELGDWEIALELCYKDVEGTIAEYTLRTGAQIGDLTGTQFLNEIIRPALERQMKRMYWRLGWFGDKNAQNIGDGGIITDSKDVKFITPADGFFKRIFAQGTANASQVTAIAANAKATFAEAKAAMIVKGVATDLVDKVLMDADARISEQPDAMLMMTKVMADALAWDLKKTYNANLEWNTIFEGFDVAEYNGVQVARIGIWDQMIRAYENSGTKLNKPYRVVYGSPQNFVTGIPGADLSTELDIWVDRKARTTNIYSTGKIGTILVEDGMFQAAY
jgi:hypothetical protein